MLEQIVNWLSVQSVQIAKLADILSGFSTVVIALLTLLLLRENKALRRAGSEPKVVAYFEPHPDGTGGLNIAISNIGTGPARDVSLSFEAEKGEFERYNLVMDQPKERLAIATLPQGEKISFLFAIGYQLFKPRDNPNSQGKRPLKPFTLNITWTSLSGRRNYSESCVLDVSQLAGLPGIMNKPYLLRIVDTLEKMNRQLGKLGSEIGKLATLIEVISVDDARMKKYKGNTLDDSSTNFDKD